MLTDKTIKNLSLPLGHYDRTKAQETMEKEYKECRKVESQFRLPGILRIETLGKFTKELLESLGIKRIKRITLNSPKAYTAGEYISREKEIKLYSDGIILTRVFLHEIAHHVVYQENALETAHGKLFCEMEKLIFQSAMIILNRNPKYTEVSTRGK